MQQLGEPEQQVPDVMKFQDALSIGNKAGGWRKLIQVLERRLVGTDGPVSTRLREVHAFGSNPGNLRMFSYRPPKLAANPALVVVLPTAGAFLCDMLPH